MQKHSQKNNKRGIKQVHVASLIPNFITISSLFIGSQQFKYAMDYRWKSVIKAVLLAAIFDVMDGKVARFFGVSSRFGAELDSLSDMVVFGVAPAFVLYQFSLNQLNERLGATFMILYIICIAIRLARFNTNDIKKQINPLAEHGYSVGLAAPSCAVTLLLPVILYSATENEIFKNSYFCLINLAITCYLSISTIATPTLKKVYINRTKLLPYTLLGVLSFISIYLYMEYSLLCIMIGYYVYTLIVQSKVNKLKLRKNINNTHKQQNILKSNNSNEEQLHTELVNTKDSNNSDIQ